MNFDTRNNIFCTKLKRKALNEDNFDIIDNVHAQKRYISEKIASNLGMSLKISNDAPRSPNSQR